MPSNNKDVMMKGSKFCKYMKIPIKFLTKARDFYIQSMTQCSAVAGYGSAMGCPAGLPRSFSLSSTKSTTNNDDCRDLLRLASLRNLTAKIESELGRQQGRKFPAGARRSCSVAIGRIDEDKACEFGDDDDDVMVSAELYSRSRSCAPAGRRRSRVF